MTGNFVLILGDDEAEAYLRHGNVWVDRMMSDIVDDITDHAGDELRAHAPGRITELVGVSGAHMEEPGAIEGVAGVEPDIFGGQFDDGGVFSRGLTSDPSDWPVFVDVGTGEFGEFHRPIQSLPGHPMVFPVGNIRIFTQKVRGQRAQHYSDRAFAATVGWVPARLARAGVLPEGGT
jgi:hypothetical protein